jgi:hypothetical protein
MITPQRSQLSSSKRAKVQFDYSPYEWEAIIACANKKRARKTLTHNERRALMHAAADYRRELELRKSRNYLPPSLIARKWKHISKLLQQLRRELVIVQKHETALRALPSWSGLKRRTWQSKEGLRIREPADYKRVLSVLDAWEWDTSSAASLVVIINQFRFGQREQDRAKKVYYRRILRVWVDMIGGNLAHSTSNSKRSGPTIRFIRAVTGPVMGEGAPKPETIRDILKWEAKLRKTKLWNWLEVVMTF